MGNWVKLSVVLGGADAKLLGNKAKKEKKKKKKKYCMFYCNDIIFNQL